MKQQGNAVFVDGLEPHTTGTGTGTPIIRREHQKYYRKEGIRCSETTGGNHGQCMTVIRSGTILDAQASYVLSRLSLGWELRSLMSSESLGSR